MKILKKILIFISILILILCTGIFTISKIINPKYPFKNTSVYVENIDDYKENDSCKKILYNGNKLCLQSKDEFLIYEDDTLINRLPFSPDDFKYKARPAEMTDKYIYCKNKTKYNIETGEKETFEIEDDYLIGNMAAYNDCLFVMIYTLEEKNQEKYFIYKDDGTIISLNDKFQEQHNSELGFDSIKFENFTIVYSNENKILEIISDDGWHAENFSINLYYFVMDNKLYQYDMSSGSNNSAVITADNYSYYNITNSLYGNSVNCLYNMKFYNGKIYGTEKNYDYINHHTLFIKDWFITEIDIKNKTSKIIYEFDENSTERAVYYSPEKNEVWLYDLKSLKKLNLDSKETEIIAEIPNKLSSKIFFSAINNEIFAVRINKNEEAELIGRYKV